MRHLLVAAEAIAQAMNTITSSVPIGVKYPAEMAPILNELDVIFNKTIDGLKAQGMSDEEIAEEVTCPKY